MQGDGTIHDKKVRDDLGDADVLTKAAQPQDGVAAYRIISCNGNKLFENYAGLVYSKWMRSFRFGNEFIKLIDSDEYYKAYKAYIQRILASESTVRLAVLDDDKDVVLGFSVSRQWRLDYVHVHKDVRLLGIGTKLIPAGIESFTHITRTWQTIWRNKYKDWKFNPFA